MTHFPSSFVTPCFSQLHRAASMIISIVGPHSSCVKGTQLLLKFQISVNLTQVPGSISTPHFIPSYTVKIPYVHLTQQPVSTSTLGGLGVCPRRFLHTFDIQGGNTSKIPRNSTIFPHISEAGSIYIQFKKPFGLEKSSPPNVVGLQSVYIIKSAPPPATQPPSLDQS